MKYNPPYCEISGRELADQIWRRSAYAWLLKIVNDFITQFGAGESYILLKKEDFNRLLENQKEIEK